DQCLDTDERRDADPQVAAKRDSRPGGDLKSSNREEREGKNDDPRSNEPKFFADERQHKIGMGFRKKEQFLLAFPQPDPEEPPAAECEERLVDLEPRSGRILLWIEKRDESLPSIR